MSLNFCSCAQRFETLVGKALLFDLMLVLKWADILYGSSLKAKEISLQLCGIVQSVVIEWFCKC
jgi:hypothetical protein